MSSPWGRCQVWHHAGHHQDRLHRAGLDLGSLRTLPSSLPTHQRQGQVSSWQAPWHAERGRRATVTPLSECHVTSSVTWSVTHAGSRLWSSNWPNIEKPPGRLSPHFIINTDKESWHQIQNREHRGFRTLWVKFHKRLSPMFHHEHTVSKPSKSDKSIRAWAHSASCPHYSPYRAHVPGTLWSCD